MAKIEKIIKKIPQKPGVYIFQDKTGRILYVGKAVNLKSRVKSHFAFKNNSPQPPLNIRGGEFVNKVADIDWIETNDEKQALLLENELIKKYQPRYNIQWRDDKSYFWVVFSDDEWPRVRVAHFSSLRAKRSNPEDDSNRTGLLRRPAKCGAPRNDNIFGPFTNGKELRQLLRALRKIMPYRTCKNPYSKPCLQWHLGLCPAHNGISHIAYSKTLNTYKNSLNSLAQFLRLYVGEPIRIEAYDISNIHGVWATGSMIVFYGDKPQKSDYRRFKIKTVRGANDIAMIKEVLRRRFGHPEWPTPDLILIDGGKAQLCAAQQIANRLSPIAKSKNKSGYQAISAERLAIIALAKQKEEIYTEYSLPVGRHGDKTLKLSALPVSLRLTFQAIRNEAHRFAIFYHRHLHGQVVKIRQRKQKR